MSFVAENTAFEAWLRQQCQVVEKDLHAKHKKMSASPFDFLRATFFRWAGTIAKICPDLATSRAVIAVGDIHVENFGTWRDVEGRLVWGVNDFDEAAVIPCAFDLVRLATSVRLAPDPQVSNRDSVDAILDGYRRGLKARRPTLLDEQETWMRPFVACSDEERAKFWKEVEGYPAPTDPVPEVVERGLRQKFSARRGRGTLRDPAQRGREPGAATLCRDRLLAGRPGRPRGKGACAFSVGLGARRRQLPEPLQGACDSSESLARPVFDCSRQLHLPTRGCGFAEGRIRARRQIGPASRTAASNGLRTRHDPWQRGRRGRNSRRLQPFAIGLASQRKQGRGHFGADRLP